MTGSVGVCTSVIQLCSLSIAATQRGMVATFITSGCPNHLLASCSMHYVIGLHYNSIHTQCELLCRIVGSVWEVRATYMFSGAGDRGCGGLGSVKCKEILHG